MPKNVDNWFAALTDEQKPLLNELREIVRVTHEGLVEELKWGRPCYSMQSLVCYLHKAKAHVVLGFQQGAHFTDPKNLLEGTGKDMRHVKIPLTAKMQRGAFKALVEEAIKYDIG